MTNEEKAEEYANACRGKIKDIHWQDVKYAVLYGLAEGEPKWHDLRKDPNDLPNGDEDCLCFISECYFVGHYAKEDKEWHFDEFISNGVIAWCELPRFEEKE